MKVFAINAVKWKRRTKEYIFKSHSQTIILKMYEVNDTIQAKTVHSSIGLPSVCFNENKM